MPRVVWKKKEKNRQNSSVIKNAKMGSRIIEMEQIVKRFPGVLANDHIDFEVRKGEIHALLGENGAGKTTLMNILYGLYKLDEGNIIIGDEKVQFGSPLDAIKAGIGMVHQHFMLIPRFTVVKNVILGLESDGFFLKTDKAERAILALSKKYGLKVDPKALVWQLSIGEQQRVEIIRALYQRADVLILDEPTSVLTPQEQKELFSTLRSMVKEGLTIIFITHKLDEVMKVTDRITVLRNGKVVATVETSRTNKSELAHMMVGREVLFRLSRCSVEKGEPVLSVEKLRVLNERGLIAVKEISFSVLGGEILGIAGVAGNGQRELAEALTGLRKAVKGKILIKGRDMTNSSPGKMIKCNVAHIPEDRLGTAVFANLPLTENIIVEIHSLPTFAKGPFLDLTEINRYAEKLISDFDVKTPSKDVLVKKLSGGNIQKLILARELSRSPELLVAVDPTRGLDVGATEYIRLKLIEQKKRGTAILLVSKDLDEILDLSDRVAVMYEGNIVGTFPIEQANLSELGLMMAGGTETYNLD